MKNALSIALSICITPHVFAQDMSQLWSERCASCHGEAAQGNDTTKSLLSLEKMAQELDRPFYESIKPGLKSVDGHAFLDLDNSQAWGLIVHLRELQSRHARGKLIPARANDGVYESGGHQYRVETVVKKGLEVPWGIEFMPDGRAIVTERQGTVRIWSGGAEPGPAVEGIPAVVQAGQGGLLDVALHPEFASNKWVYLAYNAQLADGGRRTMTKVVRGRIAEKDGVFTWGDQETIFECKPEHGIASGLHFGSRMDFQRSNQDGRFYIYFAIGERGNAPHAQDRKRPNGKVHRLWDNGEVPSDNPFVNEPDAYHSIWSYGHRNPQGLVFGVDGTLWDTEHAPRGGDELNVVEKGRNYGWPLVSFGINYNDSALKTPWPDLEGGSVASANIKMPAWRWLPSIAVCGLAVYRANGDSGFPNWHGDLFAGGLAGSVVDRIKVKDGAMVERESILLGKGRVRDVQQGIDGCLYVLLESPGRIVKISPAQ